MSGVDCVVIYLKFLNGSKGSIRMIYDLGEVLNVITRSHGNKLDQFRFRNEAGKNWLE